MTIVERALDLIRPDTCIGLGSGRAARDFVRALGARMSRTGLRITGVPTSDETARLAREVEIPLTTLADAGILDLTLDGADEVDPHINLVKGYGRALVREKIVAASSKRLVILVGEEKLVPRLGTRGKLPVEVVPFAVPLCLRRLLELGVPSVLWEDDGKSQFTDNGNHILDCQVAGIVNPTELEMEILRIPGVVGTGLFLGMADLVLVGKQNGFEFVTEMKRE